MENVRKQLVDKLNSANHVLVTVNRNPSVDQLASCIALALVLNKLGKHATAVFSGEVPSTLEFLKPEDTLEKTTDSLRDFIIALDKSKADKLRYKVEDNVVRIFITPYRTSITAEDLDFSQGDFNVDVVIALGVEKQEDLDTAITAHGRILHDATVATITTASESNLGSINWNDKAASSLCELITELAQTLGNDLLDEQVATALLTGIVAETDRFSNEKTTSQTMSMSAALMAAGANQQLVASKLEGPSTSAVLPPVVEAEASSQDVVPQDGTLDIGHEETAEMNLDNGSAETVELPPVSEPTSSLTSGSKLITEPPAMGGTLTANSRPEELDPATDAFSMPSSATVETTPLLDHTPIQEPAPEPETAQLPEPTPLPAPKPNEMTIPGMTPPPPAWVPPAPEAAEPEAAPKEQTLSDLESAVKAEEQAAEQAAGGLDAARDEVLKALNADTAEAPLTPTDTPESQPMLDNLNPPAPTNEPTTDDPELAAILGQTPTMPMPQSMPQASAPQVNDPNAPPPVPPPIPFNFGGGSTPPAQ